MFRTADINNDHYDHDVEYKYKKVKTIEICGIKYEVSHKDRAVLENKLSLYFYK